MEAKFAKVVIIFFVCQNFVPSSYSLTLPRFRRDTVQNSNQFAVQNSESGVDNQNTENQNSGLDIQDVRQKRDENDNLQWQLYSAFGKTLDAAKSGYADEPQNEMDENIRQSRDVSNSSPLYTAINSVRSGFEDILKQNFASPRTSRETNDNSFTSIMGTVKSEIGNLLKKGQNALETRALRLSRDTTRAALSGAMDVLRSGVEDLLKSGKNFMAENEFSPLSRIVRNAEVPAQVLPAVNADANAPTFNVGDVVPIITTGFDELLKKIQNLIADNQNIYSSSNGGPQMGFDELLKKIQDSTLIKDVTSTIQQQKEKISQYLKQ